jgi:hypothetical protein
MFDELRRTSVREASRANATKHMRPFSSLLRFFQLALQLAALKQHIAFVADQLPLLF